MNNLQKLLTLLVFSLVISQASAQNEIWEKLLQNERKEALVMSERLEKDELGEIILHEIVRNENGLFEKSDNFIQKIVQLEEKEPYIYALWNERFLFDDYLSSGFDHRAASNIGQLYLQEYSNTTVRDAIQYLMAIKERGYYNFDKYKWIVSKIPSIREWQVCGVFENLNNSALNKPYLPETTPQSIGGFNANSNGIVDWYTPDLSKNHVYMFFENHNEYGSGVHYAQTFFQTTEDRRVTINVGTSGKFKLWLDDVEIYENNESVRTDMDAYTVEVTIPKGSHRLLLKLASASSGGYTIVRFKELDGRLTSDITFSSEYADYIKPELSQLNPQILEHPFERYFEEKLAADPDNFLYTYCLVKMYMRNQRYKKAKEILLPLEEKYPKSSLVRNLLISNYSIEGDYSKIENLQENMLLDDEHYFGSLTYKFKEYDELMRMSMKDMSDFLDEYVNSTDLKLIRATADLLIAFRVDDELSVRKKLDELMDISIELGEVDLIRTYSTIYGGALNDEKKGIKQLEKLNKQRFDIGVQKTLLRHYNSIGRSDKVIKVLKQNVENMENDIQIYGDLIEYLHYQRRYTEAKPYIDKALKLFPYSFIMMEFKGDNELQTGDMEEALKYYKQCLLHNSGNSRLRNTVRDISDKEDIIETVRNQYVYSSISSERGKITKNNYGFNILVYDAIIELFNEAGGRGRYTMVYEITSQEGIESIKEYDLNLYRNYQIFKSEIVKPNGSVSQADRAGSSLVFENLEIGDVVYIDYEVSFGGSGRFYKDFVGSYMIDSYHPIKNARYIVFAPKDMELNFEITAGDIPLEKSEAMGYAKYAWEISDYEGLPQSENYMPETCDVGRMLHISTIKDWNEIAVWYSDLVSSQLIINKEVQEEFDRCFEGKDLEKLSDEEKAKTIYDFMMARLNYSFVSFRQSGYVPQKPSRTLATNLGDCKDFSSLFVLFSKMAGLKSNLVLVLTSDYGQNEMVLPSTDFNHCIVKTELDGKTRFLELTNKYLPFGALPVSLIDAKVLEIPFYKEDLKNAYTLQTLESPVRMENNVDAKIDLTIKGDEKKYVIDLKVTGDTRSSHSEVLENPNMDIVKEDISGFFSGSINGNTKIDSVYNIENVRSEDYTQFNCAFSQEEKVKKIGSFKVLEIPYILNAYTGDIVSNEDRKYPINYKYYEMNDKYTLEYNVFVGEDEEFVELPENVELSYKNHSYIRTYELINKNHLCVKVIAKTSLENISPDDYADFKAYVLKVLEAKDEFIGYK